MPELVTLAEARDWLRERIDEGEQCPCCEQLAKVYRRKIHAGMARALVMMFKAAPVGEPIYKPLVLRGVGAAARDESLCRYWGLIEPDEGRRDDTSSRTGWWKVTDKGGLFVLGAITVPKYARIYDGRLLNLTGDPVSIRDCLGKSFDYAELMAGE